MGGELGAGVHVDLAELGKQLKDADKAFATAVRRQVRAAVAGAGSEVLGAVRREASWSRRIPRATKLTTSFSARRSGITISTSATKAPHARPLEQGNANGYEESEITRRLSARVARSRRQAQRQIKAAGGNSRVNRHPVFRRGGFANQPTRPYFFPAVEASTPGIEASMQEALDRAVREAGFH